MGHGEARTIDEWNRRVRDGSVARAAQDRVRWWPLLAVMVGLAVALTPLGHAAQAEPAATTASSGTEPVTFDDPLLPLQWHLDRTRTRQAWSLTPGLSRVTIAVIDTGVDPDHPDLDGAFWTDASGANGFDYVSGGSTTYASPEADWHGTAVAGVAAARADDGFGMAGVAPGVRVMVRRIYVSDSLDTPPSISGFGAAAQAIRDAAAAGADVILVTWGGTQPNDDLADAITATGVPVVAAAGNDGRDLDGPGTRRYPAAYQLPNLVSVAASDRDGALLDNGRVASNFGELRVDLAAPGEDIISLAPGAAHRLFEGTSFAAPQVAGALALGRSLAPAASTGELLGELLRTVRRTPELTGRVASGGELDTYAFLQALERPVCRPDLPPTVFEDVNRRSVHVANVDCVVFYGVSQGVTSARFEPARRITRGEMASFLARSLRASGIELPDLSPERRFPDSDGSVHADAIDVIAELGITVGRTDGTFGPNERVPRGQMTTFLVRTLELMTATTYEVDRRWFEDIDGHTHERHIRIARDLGITTGGSQAGAFEPDRNVARAQMASFVARMLDAAGRQGVEVRPVAP